MAVRTSAGTTIGIVAAAPGTYDLAATTGYPSLAFTLMGEVTDLGEFGREYALVTHNPIDNRGTVKKKGSFNEGAITLAVGLDTKDAGQILAKQAANSDADYSFRVVTQNGDKYYFRAQVLSFKVGVGGVDTITTATITLEITTAPNGVGIVEQLAA